MKFIVGLLSGLVLGAVGAVAYSVSTGRDLREEYAQLRGDIDNRDFDALGNRLEQRFNELQGMLQERAEPDPGRGLLERRRRRGHRRREGRGERRGRRRE